MRQSARRPMASYKQDAIVEDTKINKTILISFLLRTHTYDPTIKKPKTLVKSEKYYQTLHPLKAQNLY